MFYIPNVFLHHILSLVTEISEQTKISVEPKNRECGKFTIYQILLLLLITTKFNEDKIL